MAWFKELLLAMLLISTTIASELKCRQKTLKFRQGCHLKDVEIKTKTTDVDVEKLKKDFKALQIENEIVNFLLPSLLKNFKAIEVLHVTNSHLKEISRDNFKQIDKVEFINLVNNDLTEINKDTFNDVKKLKSLNLGHNKINYVNSKTFSENIELESLTLSFNKITTIHENTFEGLGKLEFLDMSDNRIVELRANTFKSCLALELIDFSNNLLKYISNTAFDSISSSLKRLNLENNNCIITNEKFLNTNYSLDVTKLREELTENCLPLHEVNCEKDLKAERNEKERLKEKHSIQLEKQTKDCEISLADTKISFEKRVEELDKNLATKNSALFVEKGKMSRCKTLIDELNVKVGKCETEKKNATEYLHLTLDSLINGNNCLSISLNENIVALKREVAELRAENENLKTQSKKNNSHIYFDIVCESSIADTCNSNGVVVPFENMLLSNSRVHSFLDVKSMSISDSYMIFLPKDIFTKFKSLKRFEADNSKVRNLISGTFKEAGNLEHLAISKNSIQDLPDYAFEGARNVQFLELSFNRIKSLSENAFAGLEKLSYLTLRNNEITQIFANTFSNLVALKTLHISNNKIEHLRANLLKRNVQLEVLTISRNPIKTIDENLLDNCSNLKEVYYGRTSCIENNVKATNIQTFRNDVRSKCSVLVST